MRKVKVKILVEGSAEGKIVVINEPISFLGEVNPRDGVVKKKASVFKIKDKILVFPHTRGSTVGSYVIFGLKYYNNSPKAIIVKKAEPILITGCVISDIPLAQIEEDIDLQELMEYSYARIDPEEKLLLLE